MKWRYEQTPAECSMSVNERLYATKYLLITHHNTVIVMRARLEYGAGARWSYDRIWGSSSLSCCCWWWWCRCSHVLYRLWHSFWCSLFLIWCWAAVSCLLFTKHRYHSTKYAVPCNSNLMNNVIAYVQSANVLIMHKVGVTALSVIHQFMKDVYFLKII